MALGGLASMRIPTRRFMRSRSALGKKGYVRFEPLVEYDKNLLDLADFLR